MQMQYFSTHSMEDQLSESPDSVILEDRLSALPDSVIKEILSMMPTEDVVRTTILSKRWKDLWTSIPFLNLEVNDPGARTRTFFYQFLLRWKGVGIRNFKTSFSSSRNGNFHPDSWVRFATLKKVENLWLDLPFDWCEPTSETIPELERLPQCVYSCSSIKTLWIRGCNLEIQERVQWDNLTSLYIDASCLSEAVINQVVSSAPRLESLELRLRSSDDNLKIESSSLKMLSVTKYNVYKRLHDPTVYTVLTIRAPKLESLHLWGNAYRHCDLQMDGEIKSLALCFHEKWSAEVRQTLLQILPTVQHVEQVTLSPCAFKMLGLMQGKFSFPVSFPNVKKLELDGGPVTPKEMAGLTQLFPQLETLRIHWKLDAWYPFFLESLSATTYKDDSEANPCLNQLRTVEIMIIPYPNYDPSAVRSMLRFLRDHATEAVVQIRKGDRNLKVMDMVLDELKAKCKLKRIRPGRWCKIVAVSAAFAVTVSVIYSI